MSKSSHSPHHEARDAELNEDQGFAGLGAPLTDRVNVEPPILNGMTSSEAKAIGLAALGAWLLIGGVAAFVLGFWQFVLGAAVIGPMVTTWWASKHLASIKRDRPDGYYEQQLRIWASERGFISVPLIRNSGNWSIGRRLG